MAIGVTKIPGAMATTLIPYLPKSLAIGITIPFIAPFEAEYAAYPLNPSSAATLDIVIITPLSPCSFIYLFLDIYNAAYFATYIVPYRLISITFLKTLISRDFFEVNKTVGQTTPALANATWIVPQTFTVSSIEFFTSISFVTSHLIAINLSPENSFLKISILSTFISAIDILWPFEYKYLAALSPRPEAPPVIYIIRFYYSRF